MPKLNEENLRYYYSEKNLTQKEIGEIYNKHRKTIDYYFKKWGIETGYNYTPDITEEELERLYIEKNLTQKEIAEKYDKSPNWTRYYLDKWGIEKDSEKKEEAITRRKYEAWIEENTGTLEKFRSIVRNSDNIQEIADKINSTRNSVYSTLDYFEIDFITQSERLQKADDSDLLRKLYINQDMSQQNVANELNVGRNYVIKLLKKYNIQKKTCLTGERMK